MVVGDGGQFLENYALEFAKITRDRYHHPYASPSNTYWKMDAWFSRYDKNTFFLYVFLFPVVKQRIPVVFRDSKENEWQKLGNDEWMVEIDEGDGFAWPCSF